MKSNLTASNISWEPIKHDYSRREILLIGAAAGDWRFDDYNVEDGAGGHAADG
jgi:hypothetical protein